MAFDSKRFMLAILRIFSVHKVTSAAPKMATPLAQHGSTLVVFWNIPQPQPPANGELLPWEFKACALQVSWGWQDGSIGRLYMWHCRWNQINWVIQVASTVQQAISHQQLTLCKLQVRDSYDLSYVQMLCCVPLKPIERVPSRILTPWKFLQFKDYNRPEIRLGIWLCVKGWPHTRWNEKPVDSGRENGEYHQPDLNLHFHSFSMSDLCLWGLWDLASPAGQRVNFTALENKVVAVDAPWTVECCQGHGQENWKFLDLKKKLRCVFKQGWLRIVWFRGVAGKYYFFLNDMKRFHGIPCCHDTVGGCGGISDIVCQVWYDEVAWFCHVQFWFDTPSKTLKNWSNPANCGGSLDYVPLLDGVKNGASSQKCWLSWGQHLDVSLSVSWTLKG